MSGVQDGQDQSGTESRLADNLDHIYDHLDDIKAEAQTDEEKEAVERIEKATDYTRELALQREYPTPNQKLFEMTGGEIEKPEHPGPWEDYDGN